MKPAQVQRARWCVIPLTAALWGSACSTAPIEPATPMTVVASPVPEIRPGVPAGYLGRTLPDSLALLPPPPEKNSPGFAQDRAISRAARKLRGTPRYALASSDAELGFPHVATAFACAVGAPISKQQTPHLYLLLQRTMVDAGLATYAAKDHYKRTRPFVFYKETTCAPADEAQLRGDGSYPSGHTAIGWTWALLLTEMDPSRADAVLARGKSFGESRLICNAHWQTDVLAGRTVAASTVAMLHANADFQRDMALARGDLEAMRATGAEPSECAAEATALESPIPGVF